MQHHFCEMAIGNVGRVGSAGDTGIASIAGVTCIVGVAGLAGITGSQVVQFELTLSNLNGNIFHVAYW